MRHLNGTYTLRFNRSKKTDGSLFLGRYKSTLIGDDNYLLNISRYIHLNPLEAKLVDKAENFAWSSYPHFIGLKEKQDWLSTQHVLSQFGNEEAEQKYKMFVEKGSGQEIFDFYNQKHVPAILGTEKFIKETVAGLSADKINNSLPDVNRVVLLPSVDEIIETTALYFSLPIEKLKRSSRGYHNWPRMISIFISRRYFGYKTKEICDAFTGISSSSIYGVMQRAATLINKENKRFSELESILEKLT